MTHPIPLNAHAMIIGAMKCGTSSLYHYLTDHPQICPCIEKEPEFFSQNQALAVASSAAYGKLFDFKKEDHRYTLEGSTGYTKYPQVKNVPEAIHNAGIKPKLIYIVRNPFERITSHINFLEIKVPDPIFSNEGNLLEISDYFMQLERYRKYFPIDDMIVLDFDMISREPAKAAALVFDFLGVVPYTPTNLTTIVNETIIKLPFEKKPFWQKTMAFLDLFDLIPRFGRKIKKSILKRVKKAFTPPGYKMTEQERSFIYGQLKESMENLSRVYGVDVAKWGFGASTASASTGDQRS